MLRNKPDCHQLAASLSENYRNTEAFDKKDGSLRDYLSLHGILLTMCFPTMCSLGLGANHVAATWINEKIGATHIIPAHSGVGLLLDPKVASIQCLYPTDSGTDDRDLKGCGADVWDPYYGSRGASSYRHNPISRYAIRKFINDYKTLNFGSQTTWEEIDCNRFFTVPPPIDGYQTWIMNNNTSEIMYQSIGGFRQSQFEAIMGHPVCTPTPAEGRDAAFLVYVGAKRWSVSEFQDFVALQTSLTQNNTGSLVWNEVVIELPHQMQDIVQGVFYVDDGKPFVNERRALAHQEAKLFGNKPVFKFKSNHSDPQDLLQCDDGPQEGIVLSGRQLEAACQVDPKKPEQPKIQLAEPMKGNETECHWLAASLSENYRNTAPYRETAAPIGLDGYLSKHGLLLTMCFAPSCSLGIGARFISANWINERIGAPHIIPSQSGVGLILDPKVASVQCLYPTDSGSYERDANGCGPDRWDPQHGSQGASSYHTPITRYMIRKAIRDYKVLNFGSRAAWEDIDCNLFFNNLPFNDVQAWIPKGNSSGIRFQAVNSIRQSQFEAIMGHPVCTPSIPEQDIGFLTYGGTQPWSTDEFQDAIDWQIKLMGHTRPAPLLWNEAIIRLPRQMQDIVQGVFYVDDDYPFINERRKLAHEEAKIFGNKPVFKFEMYHGKNQDILQCDEGPQEVTTRVERRKQFASSSCSRKDLPPQGPSRPLLFHQRQDFLSALRDSNFYY